MTRKMKRTVSILFLLIALLPLILAVVVRSITFHPEDVQQQPIFGAEAAPLRPTGESLKLLSFNVQYMAGKNYVFWYDMEGEAGPDTRPSAADITKTIQEVARIIREEDPDFVLLQEVNDGAVRTDGEDQLARLLPLLPEEYVCHTSAFYLKSDFVPHPRLMGATGMKLTIISKYRITHATRYQLPIMESDILRRQFQFKRCILEAAIPAADGQPLSVLNTHLDAFAHGTGLMEQQMAIVDTVLSRLTQNGLPWIIGGDFNLLPPALTPPQLAPYLKKYYDVNTPIGVLYEKYQAVPSSEQLSNAGYEKWFTHFPNNPIAKGPDKTIDYIFLSENMQLDSSYVRHHDTLHISDHLPMVVSFRVKDETKIITHK